MYLKHIVCRAATEELVTIPKIATISKFTSSHPVFKWLNEMLYLVGINCLKSNTVSYHCLADPNDCCTDDYRHFYYCKMVESIGFFMQQPAFREHMLYALSMEFDNGEGSIYYEVKW